MKLLILLLTFTFSTSLSYGQTKIKFVIDDQPYYVEQGKLNDFFGIAFNRLVETGQTKDRYYDLWLESYNMYKYLAAKGTFSWEIYNDRMVNHKYDGQGTNYSDEIFGIIKGKTAKGNPNKKSSHAQRMAFLNGLIGREISNQFTKKTVK